MKTGLLFDSLSSNTGDIAIGIVLREELEKYGIKNEVLNPLNFNQNNYNNIIVGGGQILRNRNDKYYDSFRVRGNYILNGVGVNTEDDLNYLNDYLFLSARTKTEAEIIQKKVTKKVHVVPCITTILSPAKVKIKIDLLKQDIIGVHLVPDTLMMCPNIVDIINNLPGKKIIIPFTHYNNDLNFMKSLPFNQEKTTFIDKYEPKEILYIISKLKFFINSSLHASIFSFSQNIPFATIYQDKTFNYFKDRNLAEHVFNNEHELNKILNKTNKTNFHKKIENDKYKIHKIFKLYKEIINKNTKKSKISNEKAKNYSKDDLLIDQLENVVEHRDLLIKNLLMHNRFIKEKSQNLENEIKLIKESKYWKTKTAISKKLNRKKN